jgi:3-oxoacyl-[acyl-carrier-protein] synthase II
MVTPLGLTAEETWQGITAGRPGIRAISSFDCREYPSRIAGELPGFDPTAFIDRKEAKRMDRFCQVGLAAALMAAEDARLPINDETRFDIGVLIGTGIGGIATWEDQHATLLQRGPSRVSPFFIPMMICDMASGQVSITLGLGGPNSCVVTACATGANSIGDAAAIIARGDAIAMLAGGTESAITPVGIGGFCALRALSTRNEEPARASRPFDAERDGFVMGEGAGVLVLEELEFARSAPTPTTSPSRRPVGPAPCARCGRRSGRPACGRRTWTTSTPTAPRPRQTIATRRQRSRRFSATTLTACP